MSSMLRTFALARTRSVTPVAIPKRISPSSSALIFRQQRLIHASALRRQSSDTVVDKEKAVETKDTKEETVKTGENGGDQLTKLKEEKEDLVSRLRYAQADLINAQRIGTIEKEKARDFAISKFASDIIGTVDTLALALSNLPPRSTDSPSSTSTSSSSSSSATSTQDASDSLRTGVELTQKQLLATLKKHGVVQFNPEGEKFDPNLHEALFEVPIPNKEPGTIVQTFKVGYMIKDRCLRAAQVGVAKAA